MKYSSAIFLILFTLSLCTQASEFDEDSSFANTSIQNPIAQSRIELIAAGTTSGTQLGVSYVLTPKLLIGIVSQKTNHLKFSEGGDLDAGQYYKTTSGFSGQALLLTAKLFLSQEGITKRGWFTSGHAGRSWGKYELTQERYERDNGFIGNQFFGIDKKLADSDSRFQSANTEIFRVGLGYCVPWTDGNLLKGVSVQIQAGAETNSLPENLPLSNKFGTQDVGADTKKTVFAEIALGAYF